LIRLAVTPGEPAGIGPDLLIQLVQHHQPCELVAFADPDLLISRASLLGLPLTLKEPGGNTPAPGELAIAPVSLSAAAEPGVLNPRNARYVLNCLDSAISACQTGELHGLVTGPIHKAVINDAGIPFSGHTEFLAEKTGTASVVMMLATPALKVALVTTHLPLKAVPSTLSQQLIETVATIVDHDLKTRFGYRNPRILVCGLNPHAGEGGHMGREEIDIIGPALKALLRAGIQVSGPHPADTVFTPKMLDQGDIVIAMYHDQGLPVLKSQGFGEAVNITLGLPIIRTSVDHGTALDLAGTGQADIGSLVTAVKFAFDMAITKTGV
jgi:4-hydroxythreonine-4-phosphate dehydrogenase